VSRKTVRKYLHENPEGRNLAVESVFNFDWEEIIREHQLQDVPLLVLWEELRESGKTGWSYSYFWKQFQKRCPSTREVTMVKHHVSGERVEIDYCDGIDILDVLTGEI